MASANGRHRAKSGAGRQNRFDSGVPGFYNFALVSYSHSTDENDRNPMRSNNDRSSWRDYQASLQKADRLKHRIRTAGFFAGVSVVVLLCLGGLFLIQEWLTADSGPSSDSKASGAADNYLPPAIPRQLLPELLDGLALKADPSIMLQHNGRRLTVTTTIDAGLQKYINRLLGWSKTLQAAVVVLEVRSGKILAMASYDANGGSENLCLKADFPAASLFKIVSAAAALEAAGYTPETPMHFNGRRHTLYKQQLSESRNRWSTETKFRRAFAASNNVVFGKIGAHDLGQRVITEYADKFFFNRSIPFDLVVGLSTATVPADDFGLAEIASGFNKKTLLSPLHAAMLASVAANQGRMTSPWLVDRIADEDGTVLYRSKQIFLEPSVRSQTARDLKLLMEDTARYGTSRRAFQKLRRQQLFRNFDLGAKTGTINDPQDRFKYDWLTAFSLPSGSSEGICLGILAVHGKYLGTRATEMGRAIIHYHFNSS